MQVIERIDELKKSIKLLRSKSDLYTVGFVPTMGFLHEGHVSLLNKARLEDDIVVLSIFVNPLQFGPNEDFERYPRDAKRDIEVAEKAGVDILFMPSVQEIYPQYPLGSTVSVGEAATRLCGASRPGHFDGVATVVLKLFHIVEPDHAYFGLKDAQQVAIIRQVVRDFNVPVEIVPCTTIREPNGLALSSRNVYLSESQKEQATVLSQALEKAGRLLEEGKVSAGELERNIQSIIAQASSAEIDYATVLTYPSLLPLEADAPIEEAAAKKGETQVIVALAVKFGPTRLIDNRLFRFAEVLTHV